MPVDSSRHYRFFDPEKPAQPVVSVIGAGAVGSPVLLELAKLGVPELHAWDFDEVEGHNLANQLYGVADVGTLKVQAAKKLCKEQANHDIIVHEQAVEGKTNLGNVVFVLTDTMHSRKEIFESSLKLNPMVNLMIECRMGAEIGEIHCINPSSKNQIDKWEKSLFSDDEAAEESVCSQRSTIGATAKLIASYAVWQFINWNRGEEFHNYLMISTRPPMVNAVQF